MKMTWHELKGNSSVADWLSRGWQDFVRTWQISLGIQSDSVKLISAIAYWQLLKLDLGLILYPFISGFMVLAPLLVTGYFRKWAGHCTMVGRHALSIY